MPDHLHVFAAPGRLEISLENWIKYWKSQFTNKHRIVEQKWLTNHWDTRLPSGASDDEKWSYVRENQCGQLAVPRRIECAPLDLKPLAIGRSIAIGTIRPRSTEFKLNNGGGSVGASPSRYATSIFFGKLYASVELVQ
jgi:hypothetical protein